MRFSICVVPIVAGLAMAAPMAGKADLAPAVKRAEEIEAKRGFLLASTSEAEEVELNRLDSVEERGFLLASTAEDESVDVDRLDSVEERGFVLASADEDGETNSSKE